VNRKTAEVPVEVSCDLKGAGRYARGVRDDAIRLLDFANLGRSELSLLLTGDRRIAEMNRAYRRKRGPTDVLSFGRCGPSQARSKAGSNGPAVAVPAAIDNLLGDVVISIETAARQAREMGQSVPRRLRTLLVHGVLHLIGFDHQRAAEARLMFAVQDSFEARLEQAVGRPRRHPK
jgi:probable rRNA maturation factor